MRLEGSIDAFSLPDIFSLLSMTKKTGGLHLRRDGAHGVVWFTTGALTGGSSDVSRQSLARRVVGSGVVPDAALEAAVERAMSEEIGVVRALQQAGVVDDGALHDLTAEHVVDTVFDLLRWTDGDFAFVIDEPNPDDVGVSAQTDDVVTEARRRLEAWTGVAATIPSPQTVLSIATTPHGDPQLSHDEWSLLALVDGRRTVGEIVGLCGRGDFAVASALAALVRRGLLQADAGDGVEALLRRQEALRLLEKPAAAPTSPAAAPVPDPSVEAPTSTAPVAGDEDEDDDEAAALPSREADDEILADADVVMAPVTEIPRAKAPAQRTDVTPQRPEPLLPPRRPEHAEEPMPAAVAAGGGASPSPVPLIERDPNVNKSLLLRLIAGVRGL